MGRPLNNQYFGSGLEKIGIEYYNGNEQVDGYIIKQTGTSRYIVTTDGVETFEVSLVRTMEHADDMNYGDAAIFIKINGELEVAYVIWSKLAQTEKHGLVPWTVGGTRTKPMLSGDDDDDDTPTVKDMTLQYAYDHQSELDKPYNLTDLSVYLGRITVAEVEPEYILVNSIINAAQETSGTLRVSYELVDTMENIEYRKDLIDEAHGYEIIGQKDFIDVTTEQIEIIQGANNADELTIDGQPAPTYVPMSKYTLQQAYDDYDSIVKPFTIMKRTLEISEPMTMGECASMKYTAQTIIDDAAFVIGSSNTYVYSIADSAANIYGAFILIQDAQSYTITGLKNFNNINDEQISIIQGAANSNELTIDCQPADTYVKPTRYILQEAYEAQKPLPTPYVIDTRIMTIENEVTISEYNTIVSECDNIVDNASCVQGNQTLYNYVIADTFDNIESNLLIAEFGQHYVITSPKDFTDVTSTQIAIIKLAFNVDELTIDGQPASTYEPVVEKSYTLQQAFDLGDNIGKPYHLIDRKVNFGTVTISKYELDVNAVETIVDEAVYSIGDHNTYTYEIADTLANIENNQVIVNEGTSYSITGQTDFVDVTNDQAAIIKGASNVDELTIDGEPAIDYVEPEEG